MPLHQSEPLSPSFASPGAAADTATAVANTNVVLTYAGVAGTIHRIKGVLWSYDNGLGNAGRVTITDGAVVIRDWDITQENWGAMYDDISGTSGNSLIITLFAGGANVIGKVNALGHTTQLVGA